MLCCSQSGCVRHSISVASRAETHRIITPNLDPWLLPHMPRVITNNAHLSSIGFLRKGTGGQAVSWPIMGISSNLSSPSRAQMATALIPQVGA